MKIAVLPGDGIGPEIVAQAVKVLEALRRDGLKIEMEQAPIGGAGYDAAGDPLPEATLKLARQADAVLLGAVGGPKYDTLPRADASGAGPAAHPQGAGPVRQSAPGAAVSRSWRRASTLKPEVVSGLDIMILRELTGDIYFGQPRGQRTTRDGEREGFDTMHYSESEIRRIAHVGFEIAHEAQAASCARWTRPMCWTPACCGARS